MKSIHNVFLRAALGGVMLSPLAACDVLQRDSPQDLSPDDAFSSPARIERVAIGMYDALQNGEFLGGRALIYSDVRTNDTNPSPFFSSLVLGNITAGDGYAAGAWQAGYRSMYDANYMIRQLTERNGAGLPDEKVRQYIGEAKFCRALTHFTLVNLFAQPYRFTADASHPGITIQLQAPDGTEAYDPTQRLPRASVREVYAQVERDLLDAIDVLPETYAADVRTNISRATKDAARGLLSRLYLYKGDWANAARFSGEIVTGGRHQLNTSAYAEFRTPNGSDEQQLTNESIFFIAMSRSDNPNTNAAIAQHYTFPPGGRGDITVTPYRDALPATDKRRTELTVQRSGSVWTRKYTIELASGVAGSPNIAAWIPIVRYPEILLNRAEALVEQSNGVPTDTTALYMLNLVRNRSKPTTAQPYRATTFTTKQAFLDAILLERRFELAFEGHRLYDIFRRGGSVPARTGAPGIAYGSDRAVLPIPSTEIQRNPNLVQNPGY
jgi:starch-binding outer membrane protein, SusD/RagB family